MAIKDELFKEDIAEKSAENPRIKYTANNIKNICQGIGLDTSIYKPDKTVLYIERLLKSNKALDRLLYSQISAYIFSLDWEERENFSFNANVLLNYVLDEENNVSKSCVDFVVRLYDHFQLVIHEIENVTSTLYSGAEGALDDVKVELNKIQKDYTTILGIFASVVLTFVGGLIFTSSVLENIHQASIYRLIFVVWIIALVVVDSIMLLIKFLYNINDRTFEIKKYFIWFNVIGIAFCVMIFFAWILDIVGFKQYISNLLPW